MSAAVLFAEVDYTSLFGIGMAVGAGIGVGLVRREAKGAKTAAKGAEVAAKGAKTTVDKVSTKQDERAEKLDALIEQAKNNNDFVQQFADLAKQSNQTNSEMAGYLRDCEKSKAELQRQVNALNVTVGQLEAKVASLENEVAAGARRRSTDVRLDAISDQVAAVAADQALSHERADAVTGPEGAAADAASTRGETPSYPSERKDL